MTVTDESPTVNVEAGGNANAIVLKGKDLDALSDDPDELVERIDGAGRPLGRTQRRTDLHRRIHAAGNLPPKSAIREIRINQNPFSAEFDRLGYGRIEILTKPGTDKLHGQFFIQGNDKPFNTGNPFTTTIPVVLQLPVQRHGERRDLEDRLVLRQRRAAQHSERECLADSRRGAARRLGRFVNNPNYGVNLLNRRIRNNASARIDWQLGREEHAHGALWFLVGDRARRSERRIAAQRFNA